MRNWNAHRAGVAPSVAAVTSRSPSPDTRRAINPMAILPRMARTLFSVVLGSVALGVFGSQALCAADAAPPSCARMIDDVARLACYDRMFGRPQELASKSAADFGMSAREVERKRPDAQQGDTTATTIAAAVTAVEQDRDGRFVATLDNGQVWAQAEMNSRARVQTGDPITIRRGVLGSYLLTTKDGIATRARRVR